MPLQQNAIVVMYAWPVKERDLVRFGVNDLMAKGYDVLVLDLSRLLVGSFVEGHAEGEVKRDFVRTVKSFDELAALVKTYSSRSVFFDYVSGFSDYGPRFERLFRTLKANQVRMVIFMGGAAPFGVPSQAMPWFEKLKKRIRSATDLSLLAKFLVNRATRWLRIYTEVYPRPWLIFHQNVPGIREKLAKYRIPGDRLIFTHALDYDRYLEHRRSPLAEPLVAGEYGVFLDEDVTSHPDLAVMQIKPADPISYFPCMNSLFSEIERRIGVQIVIAAHPASRYEDDGVFGGRKVLKGKTLPLVANARFILAHASTSIGYGVLFKKPVQLVEEISMRNDYMEHAIVRMADSLGSSILYISPQSKYSELKINFDQVNEVKYQAYKDSYLTAQGAELKTNWEIVSEALAKRGFPPARG